MCFSLLGVLLSVGLSSIHLGPCSCSVCRRAHFVIIGRRPYLPAVEKKHLRMLWAKFRKYDKDKSGAIDMDEFYALIHEKRCIFGDSIFELIDIDNNGTLDFSEFVQATATYCMFGPEDVRKFCFYIFDKDKNGYIESDELTALIDMLHDNKLSGNCKIAMDKFDTNRDGKIDFGEFTYMDKAFPMLLFPAFRMQKNLMEHTVGKKFWEGRRAMLAEGREKERRETEKLRIQEEKRREKLRQREIRRKMGCLQVRAAQEAGRGRSGPVWACCQFACCVVVVVVVVVVVCSRHHRFSPTTLPPTTTTTTTSTTSASRGAKSIRCTRGQRRSRMRPALDRAGCPGSPVARRVGRAPQAAPSPSPTARRARR